MKKTNSSKHFTHATIWEPRGLKKNYTLTIENGKFKEVSSKKPIKNNRSTSINLKGLIVLPGFIDLHVNGLGDCDLTKNPEQSLASFSVEMAKRGVTTFLPTLISMPQEKLIATLHKLNGAFNLKDKGANPLGLHLEGPYIHPKRVGAHSKKSIESLNFKKINQVIQAAGKKIKMITLAPEKDPKGLILKALLKHGIRAAMGHTNADYKQATKAIEQGYHYATHLFNAMPPWHHRLPGIAGAALMHEKVYCECIPDGVHLDYATLEMVYKVKDKNKLILASDEWVGNNKKSHERWIKKGGAYFNQNQSLTGSATSLLEGIKKWGKKAKRDWTELVPLVTINPSKFLGLSQSMGSIEKGKKADFIVVTPNLDLIMTVVQGEVVYQCAAS